MSARSYEAFGLALRSSVPLTGLKETTAAPNLRIERTSLPAPDWSSRLHARAYGVPSRDTVDLAWKGRLRLRIWGRDRLLVDPLGHTDSTWWHQAVLGPGLALLVSRRLPLVFHGSSVARDGRAILLAGPKGAGKSTLAAELCSRGWTFLSDDVAAIRSPDDHARVVPSFPQLKLRAAVAERINVGSMGEVTGVAGQEKQILSVPAYFRRSPAALSTIVVLCSGEHVAIRSLGGRRSVLKLVEHLYAPRFVGRWGMTESHFTRCASLARGVRVVSLSRPEDPSGIGEVADRIERLFDESLR